MKYMKCQPCRVISTTTVVSYSALLLDSRNQQLNDSLFVCSSYHHLPVLLIELHCVHLRPPMSLIATNAKQMPNKQPLAIVAGHAAADIAVYLADAYTEAAGAAAHLNRPLQIPNAPFKSSRGVVSCEYRLYTQHCCQLLAAWVYAYIAAGGAHHQPAIHISRRLQTPAHRHCNHRVCLSFGAQSFTLECARAYWN
jgi:hypothetical protein